MVVELTVARAFLELWVTHLETIAVIAGEMQGLERDPMRKPGVAGGVVLDEERGLIATDLDP